MISIRVVFDIKKKTFPRDNDITCFHFFHNWFLLLSGCHSDRIPLGSTRVETCDASYLSATDVVLLEFILSEHFSIILNKVSDPN